jgi:hypothetical protein
MKYLVRLLFAAVGLAIGVVAVVALREATLSTHETIAPDSRIAVVVSGRVKGGEPGQSLEEMVEAQLQACRLEVSSDVVGDIEPLGNHRYRAVLAPSMDQTNRRQFRGCLEDWRIDQFQIDVIRFEELAANTA